MLGKVVDPLKQVTDPVLLSHLAKQGIDKDYVEFFQDYAPRSLGKEHNPYAKFYRDLLSDKRFMVVSGLPMVDADGVKIECGWKVAGVNYFSEKNNLFRAKVQGTEVELTIRNDQPDGRKANDKLSYKPQLFLNGVEQSCGHATLLPVDLVNANYLENTLEWDYGICKRRLRIIEGQIQGSWVFPANPNGEVRIKYNQTGDYKLRLGQFKINGDEEVIPQSVFDQAEYPFTVSDSATYYPDAEPETTSVDGHVTDVTDAIWATIKAAAGDGWADNISLFYLLHLAAATTQDIWDSLFRGIFLFDTSGLPDDATKDEAILSLYGYSKADTLGITPNICIYSSAPASNIVLAAGDYDSLGTTAFSNIITYANWLVADPFWNNFTLNAAGRAAISLTGVSKFGSRNATYDVGTSTPTWTSAKLCYLCAYASEQGNGYKPKLVVTYTVPITAKTSSETGSGSDAKITGNPLATLVRAETGSGVESILGRAITLFEIGNGIDVPSQFDRPISDAGSGVDTLITLLAALICSETGSGIEALPSRDFILPETGSGIDTVLERLLATLDIGSGIESYLFDLKDLFAAEAGLGVDISLGFFEKFASDVGASILENSYLHIIEGVKDSHDTGSGVESSSLAALFQQIEAGVGAELVVARAIWAKEYPTGAIDLARVLQGAILGTEVGVGAEASLLSYYQKVLETGVGVDASTLASMFASADTGAGVEAITLLAAMISHDTAIGIEAVLSFLKKTLETGIGLDEVSAYLRRVTDVGIGAEEVSDYLRTLVDTGASAENIAFLARVSQDTGIGVDEVLTYLRKLVDSGQGTEFVQLIGLMGRVMKLRVKMLSRVLTVRMRDKNLTVKMLSREH